MTLFDATELLLVYAELSDVQITALMKTLKNVVSDDDIVTMKSIRLENDRNKMSGVISSALKSEVLHISNMKDGVEDSEGAVYFYKVRDEKGIRLALYCQDIVKPLAVRLLTDPASFSRFQGNARIHILTKFNFQGFTLLSYLAGDSSVARYAVFMDHDADIDKSAVLGKLKEVKASAVDNTDKTNFFNTDA